MNPMPRSQVARFAAKAAVAALATALLLPVPSAQAQPPSLSDAFNQGSALGRSGNAAARGQINSATAQGTVPGYTANPPQTSYFGGAGLGAQAADAAKACAAGGTGTTAQAQGCNAVNFSQTNPTQRPAFGIAPGDPLLARGRAIAADPHSIAGHIAGTYSGCTVQTNTTPPRFETALCHQVRTTETLTCDKVLVVTPVQTPGCADGEFLTRVTADPCPQCTDYIAFDFSCAVDSYRMHVFTIDKHGGQVFMELGTQTVPGALNTQIAKTQGPSRMDGNSCYQTFYSQSCSGANCTIGAWFSNPCQRTSFQGSSTFAMPTRVSFTDAWDNRCSTLEARAR